MPKRFTSAIAFKTALEAELRKRSKDHPAPFQTLQLKFVIERLLARLFREPEPPWLLKGGFAMDLRFRPRARTTKDVDLSATGGAGTNEELRTLLQAAVDVDMGDFLDYRIGKPKHEITNAPRGGGRFPCEAVLLGKTYASFHIDVGRGDALVGMPERLACDDLLDFAGIPPAIVLAIPKSLQFAEKAHAYSFPWQGRLNTRTKDLVDMVLLLERDSFDLLELRAAIQATFDTRRTHPVPRILPPPPDAWGKDFPGMATEAGLTTTDFRAAFGALEHFWKANGLGPAPESA